MSTARINYIKKARKDQGHCECCRKEIKAGDAYSWYSVGFRSKHKHKRCDTCPPAPPSARESNEKISTVLAARETFSEDLSKTSTLDDVKSCMTELAQEIRNAGEQWEESADAIEEGFGHETEQSEEIRDLATSAECWADEVENWEPEDEEKQEGEDDQDMVERFRSEADDCVDGNEMEY